MNRIKELRKEKGLSQAELAKVLFVNQTAVSQWERGATMPSPNMLNTLADYFHVTTDYLLGRDAGAPPVSAGQKEKAPANAGASAGEPAGTPSREQMIEDIIRVYREMSDAESVKLVWSWVGAVPVPFPFIGPHV